MIYRISYIVEQDTSPGIIYTSENRPQVGEAVKLLNGEFVVIEVAEIMPPKDGSQFLVVTLREQVVGRAG